MDELWRRAAKYMQMEELALYGNQVQAETTSTKKEVDKPIFYNAKEEGGRDQLPREPRYAHYTPLNVSRSHILDQALAIETLVMSKRANTPPKVGFSMRCWYHQNRGYSIEECGVLKDKIEYLIKLGHLKDFVHMQDQDKGRERDQDHNHHSLTKRSKEKEEKPLNHPRHIINTIARGFVRECATILACKRHL